ncbi:hypothetical protein [Vibrio navarrensis]|uniref:hypothetical protein n=1 Tax=Vibrio navarrensis TaxID=29495 RepID=UPI00186745F2|nr:hypothetical protein [Vibrio navarrensis]MBE3654328.1 hypothetical protein [Vibrio navarrensis]
MSATIRSFEFDEFYVNVDQQPIHAYDNVLVYKLVDSIFPNDILKKVNGKIVATHRHVAIDTQGNGYVYDFESKSIAYSVGKCEYIKY